MSYEVPRTSAAGKSIEFWKTKYPNKHNTTLNSSSAGVDQDHTTPARKSKKIGRLLLRGRPFNKHCEKQIHERCYIVATLHGPCQAAAMVERT